MTISRTARVWVNEIRNNKGKSADDAERYFKYIFTEDEYDEFYGELMEQTKECVKLDFESQSISPKNDNTYHEIFAWMDEHINYYENIDIIIESVYTEIFQSVSGFFGTGCTDNQFEEVRDAMGDFTWQKHMEVYEYLLAEKEPKVSDWKEYVKDIEDVCGFSLPTSKTKEVSTPKIECTENLSARFKTNGANLMYCIMNTRLYDGGMGVTIVEGISPIILKEYGFDDDDIRDISKMDVGESYGNTYYGYGVIVVRMA